MIELNTSKEILLMLSKKIESERIEQHISQKDLAAKSGISYGTYRNFIDIGKISLLNFISLFHTLGLYSEINTMVKKEKVQTIAELKEAKKTKKRVRGTHK